MPAIIPVRGVDPIDRKNETKIQEQEAKQLVLEASLQLRDIKYQTEELAEYATKIKDAAHAQYYFALVKSTIENHYDIGVVQDVYRIYGGYVNTTFGVQTVKNGQEKVWIFRKYKAGKNLDALLFEHRLLGYAKERGFTFASTPIQDIEGKTYHEEWVPSKDGDERFLFAVFNYIEGEKKYDWIPNWAQEGLQEQTLRSAAQCLAGFHSFAYGFDPQGLHGDNIMDSEDSLANDLIAKFPTTLMKYRALYEEAEFDNAYLEYFDVTYEEYRRACEKNTIPQKDYSQMFICPCHCDFHPGNVKYYEDGTISGSFDYDMAKIDSRLFDLGLTIHYCFASWKPASSGAMLIEYIEKLTTSYDEEINALGILPPLNETEKKYLYEAIVQGTIYAYGWCASAIAYDTSLDPFEYLYYSRHFIHSLRWLNENESAIRALSERL